MVPKPGFAKKCAYFVTNYGSIDTKFTWMGREYDTPAGVAHYLEHKMFEMPDRDVMQEFFRPGGQSQRLYQLRHDGLLLHLYGAV